MRLALLSVPVVALFAGCWTFDETPYPTVEVPAAPPAATNLALSVVGFGTVLTEYEAVHGYRTVYVPGYRGSRHYEPGYFETVPAVTYLPQRRSTEMFLHRAQDAFERAGFVLTEGLSDLTVEVRFDGPFCESAQEWKKLGWQFGTLLFCDYGATRWTARLRVRDTKTGRLLFHRDYDQPYETHVFGLVPLFGPAGSETTSSAHMQSWCLAALTDRVVADAAAWLAQRR